MVATNPLLQSVVLIRSKFVCGYEHSALNEKKSAVTIVVAFYKYKCESQQHVVKQNQFNQM